MVLESTTYPGTTRERVSRSWRSPGSAPARLQPRFSPERIDPGRTDYTVRTTPKVVGGLTEACTEAAASLYGEICDEVVRVSGPEPAELTKLLENIFRSVNIALVNEPRCCASASGSTSGRSSTPPRPSPSASCASSRDLEWAATASRWILLPRLQGARAGLLHRVHRARREDQPEPAALLRGAHRARAQRRREAGARLKILLLGVSYKAGVGDIRESPALKIIKMLADRGAEVFYHDPVA